MRPQFLCPEHGSALVDAGIALRCQHEHSIPVEGGIPRFANSAYAKHFGLQWTRYSRSQLDSYTGLPITEERLRRCLGERLWKTLSTAEILECGCGAGRFTEVLLDRGASVTSVDLSNA